MNTPDRTLENTIRDTGATVVVLWEMAGPEHTAIDWMVGYQFGAWMCIVQTYADGAWNAFTPGQSIDRDKVVADVLARCHIPAPEVAESNVGFGPA